MIDGVPKSSGGASARVRHASSATAVLVPDVLRLYLARRCDDADKFLTNLIRDTAPGRTFTLLRGADESRRIEACSLHATTIGKRLQSAVTVTIALGKEVAPPFESLVVQASASSTDLVLPHLFESWRSNLSDRLLREKIDLPFLPRDLVIDELIHEGAGARLRCPAVVTPLELAALSDEKGLSDVYGHVSGSGRRF